MSSRSLLFACTWLALIMVLGACGDSGTASSSGREAERAKAAYTADGVPTENVGEKKEQDRLVAQLEDLQAAFRAGRMNDVCKTVSDFLIEQFPDPERASSSPCAQKMDRFARSQQGRAPVLARVVSVRVYPNSDAGIWVRAGASAYRIPFRWDDGRWELEIGSFTHPEVLNGTLVADGE